MASATQTLMFRIDLIPLCERFYTGVIIFSIIHHKTAKLLPNLIFINDLSNAGGNILTGMWSFKAWKA